MVLVVTGSVLLFCYAALILFYYYHWRRLKEFQPGILTSRPFLSVLIPARNEAENIGQLLRAIREQTLPPEDFEVVVIDDHSTDNTREIVNAFRMDNLLLIQSGVPAALSSKKKAIEAGIQQARGELIITTDADCIPTARWLETMQHFYAQTQAALITAPVAYQYRNNILEKFQALDFLVLQGITAAAVSSGLHTLCNGANLAYQATAFKKVHGFEGIDRVATGDDMLLMYKIKKDYPEKIFYLRSQDAVVSTSALLTWKGFMEQRKRWASKTPVYQDRKVQAILVLVFLLHLMFPLLLLAGLSNHVFFWYALGLILVKTIIEFPFVYSVSRFFSEERLMPLFPLFQPLHIVYTIVVGILSQAGKYEWKGRKTK